MDPRSDPHTGWLEPLLERLAQDRTVVVSPLLDGLDPENRQYSASPWPLRGVWDWGLDFHWDLSSPVSAPGGKPQEDVDILPLSCVCCRSPALGGEVLAVDRLFFNTLGAYDPGTVAWGPQQVELSFRVWSCGGALEVVPCSRVVLRSGPSALYEEPEPEQLHRDKARVAEAWMGPYRRAFYRRNTLAHSIRQVEAPNVTSLLRLQRALGCTDFSSYLSSVNPELHVPQDLPGLSGELYNVGGGGCVDFPRGQSSTRGRAVVLGPCSGTGAQHCELGSSGQLRWGPRSDLCLDSSHLLLSPCGAQTAPPASQRWSYTQASGQLLHSASQLCLEALMPSGQLHVGAQAGEVPSGARGVGAVGAVGAVVLRPCSQLPLQQWSFETLVDPDSGNF